MHPFSYSNVSTNSHVALILSMQFSEILVLTICIECIFRIDPGDDPGDNLPRLTLRRSFIFGKKRCFILSTSVTRKTIAITNSEKVF